MSVSSRIRNRIAPRLATFRTLMSYQYKYLQPTSLSYRYGQLRPLLQRNAATIAVSTTAAAAAIALNHLNPISQETILGFQRQFQFWCRVSPVIFDYYWRFASSSPYVKYQMYLASTGASENDDVNAVKKLQRQLYYEGLNAAHERHAPVIYQTMLDLKGLYIKLGQVLSVSVLPVPEPYRVLFRTLQSDVPGWEEFESVVKPILERELGVQSLDTIFSYIDPIPCGAASIGQAHKATLAATGEDVILKVQYPDASWKVPADIQCVGDFLNVCVFAGVVEKEASDLTFREFSRQFLAELDYDAERRNLEEIHASSVRSDSPYLKRGVVVPRVYRDLCTSNIIAMSYLPGPKLEEEARRQLEMFGVDTSKGFHSLMPDTEMKEDSDQVESSEGIAIGSFNPTFQSSKDSWTSSLSLWIGQVVGLDAILWAIRLARRIMLLSTASAVTTIRTASPSFVPSSWKAWAEAHRFASEQAGQLQLTQSWIDALFDVHGHQIFTLGLFNADPHPGNIIVMDEPDNIPHKRLGLIDFGQCKRLTPDDQVLIAHLIVSVASKSSDEKIADAFRALGIQTANDSTEFLAEFARLMFGPLQPYHLSHRWHRKLHELDRVAYFPQNLSMVYRSAVLLRGLSLSLQINTSVGDKWLLHAQEAIDRHARLQESTRSSQLQSMPHPVVLGNPLLASS